MEYEDAPKVDAALLALIWLHNTEIDLAELHDAVAGKGMYLAEGEPALGLLGQEIRDVLLTRLGEAVWDIVAEGRQIVITPGDSEEDEENTIVLTAEDLTPTPENIYTEPGPQWGMS